MSVLFTPTAVGLATTTLTITTSDPAPLKATLHVPISGTGVPGHLATNIPIPTTFTSLPETLGFGPVSHTGGMKSLSFKIKNTGKGELMGTVPALSAPFSVTVGDGAFDLAPGATQTETIQFAPTSVATFSVPLLITVTPPGRPVAGITVTLKGRGT